MAGLHLAGDLIDIRVIKGEAGRTYKEKEPVMIDAYRFGVMTIDGRTFTSDLLIFPDGRVADNWWRPQGHRFTWSDIEELAAARPEVLVAGKGAYGVAAIDAGLRDGLSRARIELVAARTKKAVQAFNQLLRQGRNVAGCFHLTC
jgi:hypothetical protein